MKRLILGSLLVFSVGPVFADVSGAGSATPDAPLIFAQLREHSMESVQAYLDGYLNSLSDGWKDKKSGREFYNFALAFHQDIVKIHKQLIDDPHSTGERAELKVYADYAAPAIQRALTPDQAVIDGPFSNYLDALLGRLYQVNAAIKSSSSLPDYTKRLNALFTAQPHGQMRDFNCKHVACHEIEKVLSELEDAYQDATLMGKVQLNEQRNACYSRYSECRLETLIKATNVGQ